MIIAIDIDGTIFNYLSAVLARYNYYTGDSLSASSVTDWNVEQFAAYSSQIPLFLQDPYIYDYVRPYPGALDGIAYLHSLKYRLIYVTSVFVFPDFPCHAGRKFGLLNRYGLLSASEHRNYYECSDKSLINADYLIDDGFHNISTFPRSSILVNQPWNAKHSWPRRLNSNWSNIASFFPTSY